MKSVLPRAWLVVGLLWVATWLAAYRPPVPVEGAAGRRTVPVARLLTSRFVVAFAWSADVRGRHPRPVLCTMEGTHSRR